MESTTLLLLVLRDQPARANAAASTCLSDFFKLVWLTFYSTATLEVQEHQRRPQIIAITTIIRGMCDRESARAREQVKAVPGAIGNQKLKHWSKCQGFPRGQALS